MSQTEQMTAADAISESIAHDRIVHIVAIGTVQVELVAACDDCTDAGEDEDGEAIFEYWGTRDGDTWRVHVHGASGH